MRYVLYLFTLILVFVGGMLVGNVYLPARNSSMAASISVPDAAAYNAAVEQATLETAERNLFILDEALHSCPVVVDTEKDRLFNQINFLLARQDFDIKKARFELEIAKNTPGSAVTSRFAQASADYAAALKRVEALARELFPAPEPQPQPEQKTEEKPAAAEKTISQPKPAAEPAPKAKVKPAATESTPVKAEPKADVKPAAQKPQPELPAQEPAQTDVQITPEKPLETVPAEKQTPAQTASDKTQEKAETAETKSAAVNKPEPAPAETAKEAEPSAQKATPKQTREESSAPKQAETPADSPDQAETPAPDTPPTADTVPQPQQEPAKQSAS